MTTELSYTLNFRLKKSALNRRLWQTTEHENWDAIDALLGRYIAINNFTGVWANSTAYAEGETTSDPTNGKVYTVLQAHTSPAAPTTFTEERGLHPTRWEEFTSSAASSAEDAAASAAEAALLQLSAAASASSSAASAAVAQLAALTIPAPVVGDALKFIRINAGGTAYEVRTPAQVLNAIAAAGTALQNIFAQGQIITTTGNDWWTTSLTTNPGTNGMSIPFALMQALSSTGVARYFAEFRGYLESAANGAEISGFLLRGFVAGAIADLLRVTGSGIYDPTLTAPGKGIVNVLGYQRSNVDLPIQKPQYDSGSQTITAAGALVLAHGLGAKPKVVQFFLKNTSGGALLGYANNDEVKINPHEGAAASKGLSAIIDATNITIRFGSTASTFDLLNAATGTSAAITNANWSLIVRALG